MTLLICEGACNPTLHTFDWFAERYAEALAGSGVTEVILLNIESQRKALRHTEHRHLGLNRYACVTCSAERQYGPKDWSMAS